MGCIYTFALKNLHLKGSIQRNRLFSTCTKEVVSLATGNRWKLSGVILPPMFLLSLVMLPSSWRKDGVNVSQRNSPGEEGFCSIYELASEFLFAVIGITRIAMINAKSLSSCYMFPICTNHKTMCGILNNTLILSW